MTNPDREELVKINKAGLEAAVRECARITAPDISDDEYERIKDDNSPRYQKTREEMAQIIRAYLRTIKPAVSTIVTCCVTGAIPGDGGACGDCDPCLLGEASVPSPVKRLIAEKNSLLHRIGELEDELGSLRSLASSDGGVKVKPLVWRDHRPDSFPEPAWSAQTSFGFYNIEEVSASDSPAYVVRLHAHHFVADKDSLDEAKAAAQADYEARIMAAIEIASLSDRQPLPGQKQISETGKELPKNTEQPMNNADVSVGELAGFFVTEFPHLLTMSTQIEVARALLARYRIERLDRLTSSGRR